HIEQLRLRSSETSFEQLDNNILAHKSEPDEKITDFDRFQENPIVPSDLPCSKPVESKYDGQTPVKEKHSSDSSIQKDQSEQLKTHIDLSPKRTTGRHKKVYPTSKP
ncbi:unnamed protein product, partial [Owenia fusiformis]